jgi:tetratricopeptide (TPR) repeat protein
LIAALAVALVAPSPAAAASPRLDPARTYLKARAAAISGDFAQSAELLAALVDSSAANQTIAKQAVLEAISAGDMQLALRLSRELPPAATPIEARLLQVAERLRSRDTGRALQLLQGTSEAGDLTFLRPFIEAWAAADRRDLNGALTSLNGLTSRNLLGGLGPEHRALILLKFRRTAEAEPFAKLALEKAGGREQRLRMAFADGFLAAGDRARALAMTDGLGIAAGRTRQRILQGRSGGMAIDNGRLAFSEVALALALELNRLRNQNMPIALAQIARYAAPENSSAAAVLGVLLETRGRTNEALAALRSIPAGDPMAPQARDAQVRALVGANRKQEALVVAQQALSSGADVSDYARLGDVLSELKRYDEAANAYARALELAQGGGAEERWPLLLLRASALEEANRWPEARQTLEAALALAPNEPLILNFLGYAKLERGEDLDSAEAMIRKASALDPDNASITDSLGWALYKRGRIKEAIEILTRAAKGDPAQAEIHEHLGDALYKAGNRYEARYAWEAALVTADDDTAKRVKAKIETGLTAATAAP